MEAHFEQAADALTLKLDIDEPTGILIDTAMARTDHLPFRAVLNGAGPLSGWKGKFDVTAGPAVHSTTAIEISRTQGMRLSSKGDAALGPLLAEDTRPIVGEDFTFDISATDDGKGGTTLAPSRITFAAVSLEAQGERDRTEAFLEWCRLGPPGARVTSVDLEWMDDIEGERRFEIRH